VHATIPVVMLILTFDRFHDHVEVL
jgi:hypothetical protein